MSGIILGNVELGADSWATWIQRQERGERGHLQVSLTNFGDTTASTVATGSSLEVAGALYAFTDTAITLATGTASANVAVYYVVIPSAGGTTVTIVMDSTAPIWVDAKQGFYASAASISRVIGGCYIGTALVYYEKWLYHQGGQEAFRIYADGSIGKLNASAATIAGALTAGSIVTVGGIAAGTGNTILKTKVVNIGDWNMDADATKQVTHGLTLSEIRAISVVIRNDSDAGGHLFPLSSFHDTLTAGRDPQAIISYTDDTITKLMRLASGDFDSVYFNETSYNRGWITYWYEA